MNINRIWLGDPMPDRFKEYGEQWAALNEPHPVVDWNKEKIMSYKWINQPVIDKMYEQSKYGGADKIAFYTHLADVLCYEIVYHFGGWYINTDLKPIKPLSTLEYSKSKAAFAYEDDVHLVNMAFYAPRGDLFLEAIIDKLPHRYFGMPGQGMHITTGVGLIMDVLNDFPADYITKFHRDVFNPIHFSQVQQGVVPNIDDREYSEKTIAVHTWDHRRTGRGAEILHR